MADIKATLPQDIQGPSFNDEFGDVFGIIYGITFDGFSLRETRGLRRDRARAAFMRIHDVSKIQIYGDQEEKIYLHFSPQRLAELGVTLDQMLGAIARPGNALQPSGVVNTRAESILVEISGALLAEQSLRDINLYINNRFVKLLSIATVERTYVDPPQKIFRVGNRQAIGIGIAMRPGANVLEFGENLRAVAEQLEQRFPVGIEVRQVSDQPAVVEESNHGFTKALWEAIAIVLAVSFLSLGFRAGIVVATSIPLVTAIVFLCMEIADISLQRISLGAADHRARAAGRRRHDHRRDDGGPDRGRRRKDQGRRLCLLSYGVSHADRHPGHDRGLRAGRLRQERHRPVLLLTVRRGRARAGRLLVRGGALRTGHRRRRPAADPQAPCRSRQSRAASRGSANAPSMPVLSLACMRWKYVTIAVTLASFRARPLRHPVRAEAVLPGLRPPGGPDHDDAPKNASIYATRDEVDRAQKLIDGDPDDRTRYSSYIGGGAIRFYLPLDVQLDNAFLAQFVIVTKGLAERRDVVIAKFEKAFAADFPDVITRVQRHRSLARL